MEDPVRQSNPVIIDEPFYKLGTSKPLYEAQLKERISYEVMVENTATVKHFGPYIVNGKAAKVGTLHKTAEVEAFLGIAHGGNDGSLCWNPEYTNGILMKHAYKNDIKGIKNILVNKKACSFWIGLVGGNPEVRGQMVLVGSKMTTNYESGYFPKLQKLGKQNVALLECALRNGTVSIFLVNDKQPTMSYYMGCYFLEGFSTHKENIEELRKTAEECSEYLGTADGVWCRFQERQHIRVKASPYNLPEDLEEKAWEKIVVSHTDVFPIGVKDCEGRQPNEILSLKSDKCVAYDEVLKDFIDKKRWRDLVEKDENPNEDVTNEKLLEEGALVAGKTIQVSMHDFLTLIVCISVGVFSRVQRLNIEKEMSIPLRTSVCSWFERLSPIIQTYSFPHPGRVYDTTPLALIIFSNSEEQGRNNRRGAKWIEKNKEETKEIFFGAIIATTTGRMAAFYHWTNYRRLTMQNCKESQHDKKVVLFPRTYEVEEFIDYLTLVAKEHKMGIFISAQFKSSLAPCFLKSDTYGMFLRNVVTGLDDLYSEVLFMLKEKGSRKEKMVKIMKNFIERSCSGGGGKNLPFLASQIVYNIDEMINIKPNKDWKDIEMGYGSKQALGWLQGKGNGIQKNECLQAIKKAVEELPQEHLKCMGLQRVESGSPGVMWSQNYRLFGIQDSEHFLCKLWLVIVKRAGGRPSKNPRLHYPHLHPLKVKTKDTDKLFGEGVMVIAKQSTDTFENHTIRAPDFMCNW